MPIPKANGLPHHQMRKESWLPGRGHEMTRLLYGHFFCWILVSLIKYILGGGPATVICSIHSVAKDLLERIVAVLGPTLFWCKASTEIL
jgi:hypothetical protein